VTPLFENTVVIPASLDRPPPHRFHLRHVFRDPDHDDYDDDLHAGGAVGRAQIDPASNGPAPKTDAGAKAIHP
jgi:hypothetical protein